MFPEHTAYVEAFAGGAQVLFHKEPSKVEVLNDIDGDIVNFFRVCQSHYQELVRYMTFMVSSREWFEGLLKSSIEMLTDVQRAARFFYLQKNAYAGLVRGRAFGYSLSSRTRFDPRRIPQVIRRTHERLQCVQIERLPYQEIFKRYDRPETFFYLDPPYWNLRLYNFNFTAKDFEELRDRLLALKGKFLLSLNDTKEVRELFRSFKIQSTTIAYTAQREAGKRFKELLIRNY